MFFLCVLCVLCGKKIIVTAMEFAITAPHGLITPKFRSGELHRARLPCYIPRRNSGRQRALRPEPRVCEDSWASVPLRDAIINLTGSFIVGFFVIWTAERVLVDPRWRLLMVVGFCGGFTTFSSYAFETMAYFEQGQWLLLATNILTNNLLCLSAALAGMGLARVL